MIAYMRSRSLLWWMNAIALTVLAVLLTAPMAGCDLDQARLLAAEARDQIAVFDERIAGIESKLAAQRELVAASGDEVGAEALADLEELLAETKEARDKVSAKAEALLIQIERAEDGWGVAEAALTTAAGMGVPFAGLGAVLVGSIRRSRGEFAALVGNVEAAKVETTATEARLDLQRLREANVRAGIQGKVKAIRG